MQPRLALSRQINEFSKKVLRKRDPRGNFEHFCYFEHVCVTKIT